MKKRTRYKEKMHTFPCVSRPDLIQEYEGKHYEIPSRVPKLFKHAPFQAPQGPARTLKPFQDYVDQYCYAQNITQRFQENEEKLRQRILRVRQKMKNEQTPFYSVWNIFHTRLIEALNKLLQSKRAFEIKHRKETDFYFQAIYHQPALAPYFV